MQRKENNKSYSALKKLKRTENVEKTRQTEFTRGGTLLLCELGTRLSTFKFRHKFGITTVTTSLCSTTEIQIRETVFPNIIIMYSSLDGVNRRRKKPFCMNHKFLICCYNLLNTGYYFLGCYWSASESHQILQHFS